MDTDQNVNREPLVLPETRTLLHLLGCALNSVPAQEKYFQGTDEHLLEELAKGHMVGAFSGPVCLQAGLVSPETADSWQHTVETGVYKAVLFEADQDAIEALLEENGIAYLPLKGRALNALYPPKSVRETADIDILIPASGEEAAYRLMLARGYKAETNEGSVCYEREPMYVVELQTDLIQNYTGEELHRYFSGLFDRAKSCQERPLRRELSPDDHYLYIIAHGYKHYSKQGIGLRFLCDIYVCCRAWKLDRAYLDGELKRLKLLDFEREVRELGKKLFDRPGELDEALGCLTPEEENLLKKLSYAGAFGTFVNQVRWKVKKFAPKAGRMTGAIRARYILYRLFPPPEEMWKYYTFFDRHRFLTPFLYVYRFYRAFATRWDFVKNEIKALIRTRDLDPS